MTPDLTWYKLLAVGLVGGVAGVAVDVTEVIRGDNDAIHDLVFEMGGSFSAEHGVGQLKRAALKKYRPAIEVDMMRRLKATLDPLGIMNPGKVI